MNVVEQEALLVACSLRQPAIVAMWAARVEGTAAAVCNALYLLLAAEMLTPAARGGNRVDWYKRPFTLLLTFGRNSNVYL